MKKIIISCFCFLLLLNISCNNYELEKDQEDINGIWSYESGSGGNYPLSYTSLVYEVYFPNKTWFYFVGFDAPCFLDKSVTLCPDRVYSNPGRNNDYVSDTLNYWIKGDKLIRERRLNILDRNSEIVIDTLVVEKITNPLLSKDSDMRMKPWNRNAFEYFNSKVKIGDKVLYKKMVWKKSYGN